jgi:hypothetical protein
MTLACTVADGGTGSVTAAGVTVLAVAGRLEDWGAP